MKSFYKTRYTVLLISLIVIIIALLCIFAYKISKNEINIKDVVADLENEIIDKGTDINEKITNNANNINQVTNIVEPILGENIYLENNSNVIDNKHFFYNQLTSEEKDIYNALENNKEKLKKGNYEIDLPSSIGKIYEEQNGEAKLNQMYQNVMDAFNTDNIDIFYIDSTKIYLLTKITTKITTKTYDIKLSNGENLDNYYTDYFTTEEQVTNAINYVEEESNKIISNISGNNYDKIKQIHDWIVDNIEYDQTYSNIHNNNIYGALKDRKVVCEGYAKLMKSLLDKINIPNVLVSGIGTDNNGNTENHMWNYVMLNGNWYAVDCTWDDPIIIGNGRVSNSNRYKYFLKGSNDFMKDHKEIGNVSSSGMVFTYPELSKENY